MRGCMKIPALAKLERDTHQERIGPPFARLFPAVIQSSLASHMGVPHGNF